MYALTSYKNLICFKLAPRACEADIQGCQSTKRLSMMSLALEYNIKLTVCKHIICPQQQFRIYSQIILIFLFCKLVPNMYLHHILQHIFCLPFTMQFIRWKVFQAYNFFKTGHKLTIIELDMIWWDFFELIRGKMKAVKLIRLHWGYTLTTHYLNDLMCNFISHLSK